MIDILSPLAIAPPYSLGASVPLVYGPATAEKGRLQPVGAIAGRVQDAGTMDGQLLAVGAAKGRLQPAGVFAGDAVSVGALRGRINVG